MTSTPKTHAALRALALTAFICVLATGNAFAGQTARWTNNGTYISVIGNNLANINTVGFKASSVTFQDLNTITGTNVTNGVVVIDAAALASGRFADDPRAVAAQRAADPALDPPGVRVPVES